MVESMKGTKSLSLAQTRGRNFVFFWFLRHWTIKRMVPWLKGFHGPKGLWSKGFHPPRVSYYYGSVVLKPYDPAVPWSLDVYIMWHMSPLIFCVYAWPNQITRPDITHFAGKNSRPRYQCIFNELPNNVFKYIIYC